MIYCQNPHHSFRSRCSRYPPHGLSHRRPSHSICVRKCQLSTLRGPPARPNKSHQRTKMSTGLAVANASSCDFVRCVGYHRGMILTLTRLVLWWWLVVAIFVSSMVIIEDRFLRCCILTGLCFSCIILLSLNHVPCISEWTALSPHMFFVYIPRSSRPHRPRPIRAPESLASITLYYGFLCFLRILATAVVSSMGTMHNFTHSVAGYREGSYTHSQYI